MKRTYDDAVCNEQSQVCFSDSPRSNANKAAEDVEVAVEFMAMTPQQLTKIARAANDAHDTQTLRDAGREMWLRLRSAETLQEARQLLLGVDNRTPLHLYMEVDLGEFLDGRLLITRDTCGGGQEARDLLANVLGRDDTLRQVLLDAKKASLPFVLPPRWLSEVLEVVASNFGCVETLKVPTYPGTLTPEHVRWMVAKMPQLKTLVVGVDKRNILGTGCANMASVVMAPPSLSLLLAGEVPRHLRDVLRLDAPCKHNVGLYDDLISELYEHENLRVVFTQTTTGLWKPTQRHILTEPVEVCRIAVRGLNNITELELRGIDLSQAHKPLLLVLQNTPRLEKLRIVDCDLDDCGLDIIAGFKCLTHLDVSRNNITHRGIASLSALRRLKYLDLSYNKQLCYPTRTCQESKLGVVLRNCPRLVELHLAGIFADVDMHLPHLPFLHCFDASELNMPHTLPALRNLECLCYALWGWFARCKTQPDIADIPRRWLSEQLPQGMIFQRQQLL